MTFKTAVKAAPHPVNGAYRRGKQALERKHRALVVCKEPALLTGSIDLDATLRQQKPNDNRWDYGLGLRPQKGRELAVWVEVHSATTSEVSTVLRKLQWLKDWLNGEAEQLKRLTQRTKDHPPYVWIASKGDRINRTSRQFRELSQSGLSLKSRRLELS